MLSRAPRLQGHGAKSQACTRIPRMQVSKVLGFIQDQRVQGSSSLIICLPQKNHPQEIPEVVLRQGCNPSQTSNLTTRRIKQARSNVKKNEINTRIGAQQNVPARGSGNRVPAGFQQGFAKFPARFLRLSSTVPMTLRQGSSEVPAKFPRFQQGSSKVPEEF